MTRPTKLKIDLHIVQALYHTAGSRQRYADTTYSTVRTAEVFRKCLKS